MPAYIVFTREKTRNQVEYDEYKSSVRATLVGHSAKLLALGGNYEVLEGAATEGVFLMEFPSYVVFQSSVSGTLRASLGKLRSPMRDL